MKTLTIQAHVCADGILDLRIPTGLPETDVEITAWDAAHAALFLASEEAKFITGAILPVDGGQSARVG